MGIFLALFFGLLNCFLILNLDNVKRENKKIIDDLKREVDIQTIELSFLNRELEKTLEYLLQQENEK